MSKGTQTFVVLGLICIGAEFLDRSSVPMIAALACVWEIAFFVLGIWKALDVFNKWPKD